MRARKKSGDVDSNAEKRAKQRSKKVAKDNRWSFRKLFAKYLASRPDLKVRGNDERRFKSYLTKPAVLVAPVNVPVFEFELLYRSYVLKTSLNL